MSFIIKNPNCNYKTAMYINSKKLVKELKLIFADFQGSSALNQ